MSSLTEPSLTASTPAGLPVWGPRVGLLPRYRTRIAHPVPGGIFTLGMPRMITRCRRATRLGFTCGLKIVRGLGIIAARNAASRAFRFAAGL